MNGPALSIMGNAIIATDPQARQVGQKTYVKVQLAELPVVESQTKKRAWIWADLVMPKGMVPPPKGTPIAILSGIYEVSLVEGTTGEEPKRYFNITVHSWRILKTRAGTAGETVPEPVKPSATPATSLPAPSPVAARPAPVVPPPEDDEDVPF
jgi:hypothetical protein